MFGKNCYDWAAMDKGQILEIIGKTESPLKKQLLMVALITRLLEEAGKPTPVIIGGCALAYYSREIYFTADIDLAYGDREALDQVLKSIGFRRQGRYWVHEGLKLAVEAPASNLAGDDAPVETVELGEGLRCTIIGIEDLIVDRLNACKHWKSEIDCEMAVLLVNRYVADLDWTYLERKAAFPENDTVKELRDMKGKVRA